MKNRNDLLLSAGFGSTVFILMIVVALAVVRPIFVRLTAFLSATEQNVLLYVQDKTGLTVTYEKLAPSVLSGLRLKGIELRENEKKVAEIKQVTVSYRITDFFSKYPLSAIKSISVNGITLEYDAVKDGALFEKLRALVPASDEPRKKERKTIDFEHLSLRLPFIVQLKNIALHYSDENNDALLSVKQVSLTSQFDASGIDVKTEGRISVRTSYITDNGRWSTLASGFSLDGTFFPELNGSTASLKLTAVNAADYTVTNAELLANYTGTKLQMRSMHSVLPYALYVEADSNAKTVAVNTSFEDFDPLSLVHIKKMPQILRSAQGMRLNGSADFSLDAEKHVAYALAGSIRLPESLLGYPLSVAADISGTQEKVTVSQLVASGKNLQATLDGSYDIRARQPSGSLSLDYLALKNGGVLSTEVYIEPYRNGFMFFSPQLFLGERSITALQLTALPASDSWDFVFECDDYAHADFDQSGHIQIEGSYLQKSAGGGSYIQAQLSVSSLFLDSLLQNAAFFLPPATAERINAAAKSAAPYIINNDVYFSTDFKGFSFNAPYFLLANTQNDRELVMFAADGSDQTMQISNLDVQYGSMTATASLQADFEHGFDDFTFFGDATVNTLPYRFNGNYASNWLSVSGDYDFDAAFSLDSVINGSVHFASLPVRVGKNIFAVTADSAFSWSELAGPSVELYQFMLEDAGGSSRLQPKLSLAGTANHNSFVLSSLSYTDTASILDGSGNILWNINAGIFDSIHIDLSAESAFSGESLSVAVDFVNPLQLAFSADALKNDFYMSAIVSAKAFPASRLIRGQNADDLLSAEVTASGTLANPFVTANIKNASLSLLNTPCLASGTISYDDSGLRITDINGSWNGLSLSSLDAELNFSSFTGNASCAFSGTLMNQTFSMPLTVSLESVPALAGEKIPSYYTVHLQAPEVSGTLFPKGFPVDVMLMRSPERYDLVSADGFTATLLSDGTLSANTAADAKTSFALAGSVGGGEMNLAFTGIKADLADISSHFYFPWVQFGAGVLTGSFRIKGIFTDPEFSGAVAVSNPSFVIPLVSPYPFKAKRVLATIGDSTLTVEPTRFENTKGALDVDTRIEFDRWKLGQLSVNLKGVSEKYVPVDMFFPMIHFKGGAVVDLNLLMTMNELALSGTINGQNGEIELQTSSWQGAFSGDGFNFAALFAEKKEESALPFDVICDLRLIAKNKIQIVYNPFLRGIIVPDTELDFAIDTSSGNFLLKGDVALRGGEVIWLNRNFYMKEGRIVFNESQDIIDPRLTVRAETRERDSNGTSVTISLSANNQPVSVFNPRLSATPAKSEAEIMELFGEIVTADSDNAAGVATAAGDYLVNATVMRKIENSLRELTNFDIFSVRTTVLQNAVNQSTRNNADENSTTFGNFFDNSTVYIGKYFGSSVYVDALMQWTYDETKSNETGDVSSLVFHPEIGFEMTSPFVNIRWGIAPDIEAIQTSKPWFVPSASITLSWKISF